MSVSGGEPRGFEPGDSLNIRFTHAGIALYLAAAFTLGCDRGKDGHRAIAPPRPDPSPTSRVAPAARQSDALPIPSREHVRSLEVLRGNWERVEESRIADVLALLTPNRKMEVSVDGEYTYQLARATYHIRILLRDGGALRVSLDRSARLLRDESEGRSGGLYELSTGREEAARALLE